MRNFSLPKTRRVSQGEPPLRPLLFDRLTEEAPTTSHTRLQGDGEQLIRSIQREIALLLNVRRTNPELLDPATATALDYGIPNFTFRSTAVPLELKRLALLIENAISIFEPRLLAPRVELRPDPDRQNLGIVEISGSIRVGTAVKRFSFPLALDEQTMMTEILPPDTV